MNNKINEKIPTTIVTGFLGSGKTTIISHLIDYLIDRKNKIAYIKNEIGSENIDGVLMKGKHIETRELLNGCICCTLTGSFYYAISEIADIVKPDRLFIEASGVASPAAIALLVSSHDRIYRDGLISIIDVVNFEGYKDLSLSAREQARLTDIIVFNKVEQVDLIQKKAVVGYIRELNEYSPIVEAQGGLLNPNLVFGLDSKNIDSLIQTLNDKTNIHLQTDRLESFTLKTKDPIHNDVLKVYLEQLPENIIRVKGIIKNQNGQVFLVNKVGIRTEIQEIQTVSCDISRLVFIGFDILNQKKLLTEKFNNSITST